MAVATVYTHTCSCVAIVVFLQIADDFQMLATASQFECYGIISLSYSWSQALQTLPAVFAIGVDCGRISKS